MTLMTLDPDLSRGPLTKERARLIADAIKSQAETMSLMLLELYNGEGWQLLGYSSWRECVKVEFGWSTAHMYRLLNAAEVEQNISPIGGINERVARELAPLPAEQQKVAYTLAQIASGNEQPTARTVKAAVEVLQEAVQTGGYVSINGTSKGVLAALTEAEDELMQRTRQHIIDSQVKKHGERLITFPAQVYELNRADPEKGTMTTLVLIVPSEALLPFEAALKDSRAGVVQCSVYKDETALIDETVRSI